MRPKMYWSASISMTGYILVNSNWFPAFSCNNGDAICSAPKTRKQGQKKRVKHGKFGIHNISVCFCHFGEKGRRIRELTSVVQKRFKFPENSVELYAEKVNNRGLCAIAQAESLRYKLLGGLAVRRACYGVLRFVMESGAKGCEVIVSGKLRAQRAKSMKFKDGYMISSGQPVNEYIDAAVRHVLLRQGVLGIKVKIMLDWDPKGKQGPTTPLPDLVTIHPPKEEEEYILPVVAPTIEVPVDV